MLNRASILNHWLYSCFYVINALQLLAYFSSVQLLSHVWFFVTPWTAARQARCPSPPPGVYSNSSPVSRWCHPTISSSVVPFSSCPQFFPASGSFPMSQLFASGGQSVGVSASVSVSFSISPSNEHLGLISFRMDWLDLLAVQRLSRVFSSTTVKKHQFFGAQLSLWSNSYIHTWQLKKS